MFVPGLMTALALAMANAGRRIAVANSRRRAMRPLVEWDARALEDIGLTRHDVRLALRLPFHSDPTAYLSRIAAARCPGVRQDSASRAVPPSCGDAAGRSRPGNLPSAGPAVCA